MSLQLTAQALALFDRVLAVGDLAKDGPAIAAKLTLGESPQVGTTKDG